MEGKGLGCCSSHCSEPILGYIHVVDMCFVFLLVTCCPRSCVTASYLCTSLGRSVTAVPLSVCLHRLEECVVGWRCWEGGFERNESGQFQSLLKLIHPLGSDEDMTMNLVLC